MKATVTTAPVPSRAFAVLALAAVALLATGLAGARSGPYTHSLDPSTGSSIRHYAVQGSAIPTNRKWHELTPEQQDQVRKLYEPMASGSEPPFPADGLKPIYEALAQGQGMLQVTGELTLVATVATSGEVQQVQVIGGIEDMTEFASRVLMAARFKPALCQGQPCQMDYPLRIAFKRKR